MATYAKRRPPAERLNHLCPDYARRVQGGAWQARLYIGGMEQELFGSTAWQNDYLNLGIFTVRVWGTSEEARVAAVRASREFLRHYTPVKGLRHTMEYLKETQRFGRSVIPSGVLPPRVRRVEGGYQSLTRRFGVEITDGKIHQDPWIAFDSLCSLLRSYFPHR